MSNCVGEIEAGFFNRSLPLAITLISLLPIFANWPHFLIAWIDCRFSPGMGQHLCTAGTLFDHDMPSTHKIVGDFWRRNVQITRQDHAHTRDAHQLTELQPEHFHLIECMGFSLVLKTIRRKKNSTISSIFCAISIHSRNYLQFAKFYILPIWFFISTSYEYS